MHCACFIIIIYSLCFQNRFRSDCIKCHVSKTNNSNDSSFDINSIIGSLTGSGGAANAGGSGFNLQGLIGKFTGGSLDANGDGQVGLDDIISKVSGGAKQQQQGGGGGLMDMIKGFMK